MKLTEKWIAATELPPGKKQVCVYDDALPGFGVCLGVGGASYIIQYWARDKARRRLKIGRCGKMRLEQARAAARELFVKIASGEDPVAERRAARGNATLREFWESQARPHFSARIKASSLGWYDDVVGKHLLPRFGAKPLEAITRQDVVKFHAGLRATPYAANRSLAALRSILNYAISCEVIGANPALRIQKFREKARECVLGAEELRQLLDALDAADAAGQFSAHALAALRFILWTGVRKTEATGLRWAWVSLARRMVRYPDTKGGARTLALSEPAFEILQRQEAQRNAEGFVFPAAGGSGGANVEATWKALRAAAGLPNLRIHDLRHNAGTWAALSNMSGPTIKAMLGHRDLATSEKYIHMAGDMDPIRLAVETVAAAMQEAVKEAGKQSM